MIVLEEDNITSFDVDNTLVIWPKDPNTNKEGRIHFVYGHESIYLYPHKPHIRFLKNCSLRGDYVEVWSKNGYEWAEHVINTLTLENYVDVVRAKPSRCIDDKTDLPSIVGERIYMYYDPEGIK